MLFRSMRWTIALLSLCAITTGCESLASGKVEGGSTSLFRQVETDAGSSRSYRRRTITVGEAPPKSN